MKLQVKQDEKEEKEEEGSRNLNYLAGQVVESRRFISRGVCRSKLFDSSRWRVKQTPAMRRPNAIRVFDLAAKDDLKATNLQTTMSHGK